jgi:WD40 repeat protein
VEGISPPTTTVLEAIDLSTNTSRIILERTGIDRFAVSPDGNLIAVLYYSGEYGRSDLLSCILNVETGLCSEIDLPVSSITWISDEGYAAVSSINRGLYTIDAETLTVTRLPVPEEWFLYSVTKIPDRSQLLISGRLRTDTQQNAAQFLLFDLAEMQLSDFQYDAVSGDYASVSEWHFSPDGRYLLYGGYLTRALVEFETGALIAEFSEMSQPNWLKDNETLLGSITLENGGVANITFDAVTEETRLLSQSETSPGILVVP